MGESRARQQWGEFAATKQQEHKRERTDADRVDIGTTEVYGKGLNKLRQGVPVPLNP